MAKITATNRHTGEIVELPAKTPEEIVQAWNIAKEYEKVAVALKNQLKQLVPKLTGDFGRSEEINGYMFKITTVQRKDYDKTIMREVFDEDTFDLLLKPDKTAVDNYLKEHLEELGEASTKLRNTMVDSGKPYEVIKLEKLNRD